MLCVLATRTVDDRHPHSSNYTHIFHPLLHSPTSNPPTASRRFERKKLWTTYGGHLQYSERQREIWALRGRKWRSGAKGVFHGLGIAGFRFLYTMKGWTRETGAPKRNRRRVTSGGNVGRAYGNRTRRLRLERPTS